MSYRTNDRLHGIAGVTFALLGLVVDVIAGGGWWYSFHQKPTDAGMIVLCVVLTLFGTGVLWTGVWVLRDIVRVRRMK